MAAQSGNDDKKGNKVRYAFSVFLGGLLTKVLDGLLNIVSEDRDLSKIGAFFNSWPFFYTVLCICATMIIVVFILQMFKTIRHKKIKDENRNLKNRNEKLEEEIKDQKDENMKLQIKIAQMEERTKLLEEIHGEKKSDSITDFFGKKRK